MVFRGQRGGALL